MLGAQKGSPATAVAGRGPAAESAGPSLGRSWAFRAAGEPGQNPAKGGQDV